MDKEKIKQTLKSLKEMASNPSMIPATVRVGSPQIKSTIESLTKMAMPVRPTYVKPNREVKKEVVKPQSQREVYKYVAGKVKKQDPDILKARSEMEMVKNMFGLFQKSVFTEIDNIRRELKKKPKTKIISKEIVKDSSLDNILLDRLQTLENLVSKTPNNVYEYGSLLQILSNGTFVGNALSLNFKNGTNSTVSTSVNAQGGLDIAVNSTGGGGTWYQDEVPTGTVNGSNKTFTLAHTPTSVAFIFVNGQLQVGGVDYVRTGENIAFTNAPLTGDSLTATYQ